MKPVYILKFLPLRLFRLVSIVGLILQGFSVIAQISVIGTVSDKATGLALPYANVSLKNTFISTISNDEGKFLIHVNKTGIYTLTVSYIGYQLFERSLELNGDMIVDVSLLPVSLMTDEVIISGTRIDHKTPLTYKNLDKSDIAPLNLGQDMPYLLQLTPSLVVTSDAGNGIGYTSMRIRGTDITRINVTVNGIPLNDPESQSVYWVDVPDLSSSVESIQVQRGVGTSTNGAGAFGASVNISTQNVIYEPYAEFNSGLGSFNTLKNSIKFGTGLIGGRWTIDGRLSKTSSDGYVDRAWSDLKSFYTSATMVDENNLLKINVFSGVEETYQAWNGVPSELLGSNPTFNPSGLYYDENGDTAYYDNEIDHYQQDHFQVIYARSFSQKTELNLALHYTHGNGYYENYKMDQKFSNYGLQKPIIGEDTIAGTDLVRQKWLDNHFYGLTFSLNTHFGDLLSAKIGGALNQYQGDHFGTIPWAAYSTTIPMNFKWYENDGLKTDFNIYSKFNLEITKTITGYLDLQYRFVDYQITGIHDDLRDISQTHEFHFFNPKTGIFMKMNDRLDGYVSVGIANREPTRNDFRDADETLPPVPEKMINTELGSTYKTGKLLINANLYWMDYKNQLIQTGKINNVGDPVMINVPKSYRAGIELSGSYIPLEWLRIELSTTLSRNRIIDFVEYVDNWSPPYSQIENNLGETHLAFSPDITGFAMLEAKIISNLTLKMISRYVGKQYIDNTGNNSRTLDPYLVNDLNLVYRLKTGFIPEIEFSLLINNILSEKYETNAWIYRYYEDGEEYNLNGYFPQAPVNLLAGLKLKF